MPKHHVPLLRAGFGRHEDPETSRDPQIAAVMTALKALSPDDVAPAPRAHFRAELRTQLVAVAPRLIAEGAAETAPTIESPARAAATPAAKPQASAGSRAGLGFGRPLRVAGAVLTLVVVILGGAVWASQRALPGDALYGLKRTTESVRLALAGSDTARAKLYLGFAGTRVDEAKALVERSLPTAAGYSAASRVSPSTAALVRSTLGSADTDVKSASRLLTAEAVRTHDRSPLTTMQRWAPSQVQRLKQLSGMLPGALRHRALTSEALVHRVALRAGALEHSFARKCTAGARSDALGVQPCTGSSSKSTHPSHGSQHGSPRPGHRGGQSTVPAPGGGTRTGGTPPGGGRPTSSGPGGHKGSGSSTPTLPVPLPTLPSVPLPTLPTVSLPVSLGNSCVSLPLGISLGNCPSS